MNYGPLVAESKAVGLVALTAQQVAAKLFWATSGENKADNPRFRAVVDCASVFWSLSELSKFGPFWHQRRGFHQLACYRGYSRQFQAHKLRKIPHTCLFIPMAAFVSETKPYKFNPFLRQYSFLLILACWNFSDSEPT